MRDPSAAIRAIVLHSPCTGRLPRSYRGLGRGHKIIYRSWKASMAPSSPRPGSTRARHDDPSDRPDDPPRPPLSQRSFLWPKRLAAGVAAAKGGSGEAVGAAGVVGALNTISNYVTRPRCTRPNTPHGAFDRFRGDDAFDSCDANLGARSFGISDVCVVSFRLRHQPAPNENATPHPQRIMFQSRILILPIA